jgi:hypothetical protein
MKAEETIERFFFVDVIGPMLTVTLRQRDRRQSNAHY